MTCLGLQIINPMQDFCKIVNFESGNLLLLQKLLKFKALNEIDILKIFVHESKVLCSLN